MALGEAAGSDFLLVNLIRGMLGAPMRLDAVNALVAAAAARAGVDPAPRPHQMRHAFASNVLDAGGTGWRMRARHRLHEPETAVDRASD